MPVRRAPTLPFRAGYARGRGEAAVRTREMQFKVAFEDVRAQRRLQEIGVQFQMAQKRMQMASAIEQQRQQQKAGAEALGMEAARRGEEVQFKDPHSALAYAETRRQMGAREQVAEERRKTLAETFERELEVKGFEEVPAPVEGAPAEEGIVTVAGKRYRRPPADVGKLMAQVSQAAREFVLREGTPKSPEEFQTRLREFHKVKWEQTQAETRAEAMSDADEAYRDIARFVKGEGDIYEGRGKTQVNAVRDELETLGFTEEEIASVARIETKGWNRAVIQWAKLRDMLFRKRLARVGVSARPAPREGERSKTEAFLETVERE